MHHNPLSGPFNQVSSQASVQGFSMGNNQGWPIIK